jgi:protein subunit release factor B
MPPRPKPPPEEDIEEYFIHGSGPGGQKIVRPPLFPPPPSLPKGVWLTSSLQNKTASAVQLKHIPTGIVVKSQATRSREQNRKIARELLAERLDVLNNSEKSRKNIVETFKKKRADSSAKKSRRKYRMLEEEKAKAAATEANPGCVDTPADAVTQEQSATPSQP